MLRFRTVGGLIMIAAALASSAARAAEAPPKFTAAQAAEGAGIYQANCATCHGSTLDNGQFAAPIKGSRFIERWAGRSVGDYLRQVSTTMPPTGPGSLGGRSYAAVVAYLLQANGLAAGDVTLESDPTKLTDMVIPSALTAATTAAAQVPAPSGETPSQRAATPRAAVNPTPREIPARLKGISPVTEEMLRAPAPGDWLMWRRTPDSHGFSPLKQITPANIKSLNLAWAWALVSGAPMEATPLVHDGILFIQSGRNVIQALDAATGDLLWTYTRELPDEILTGGGLGSIKRNMAIHGHTLLAATADAHVVALDVRSGAVIWDTPIEDYRNRWILTGGPLVAKGKVIQGISGSFSYKAGGTAVVALDVATGKEAWRFNIIPREGEPGSETWNDLPFDQRSGGSVWTAGSYDPQTGLVYIGTGQSYATGGLRKKVARRGVSNDALYTDTTLALDPETGKLVWYFQHMPNDQWDHDWAFERTLVTLNHNGAPRRLVVTGGKVGIFDALDAATGKYAFSYDFGLQNVVTGIDPKTGAKRINPDVYPVSGETRYVCPSLVGVRNWPATSFDPASNVLYVPMAELCMQLLGDDKFASETIAPRGHDGNFGRLAAVDLVKRKVVWTERRRAPQTSAVLATAGGVVFNSDAERWFRANEAATGKELWKMRLNDVANAFPISYEVGGRQYVAIAVGGGSPNESFKAQLTPERRRPSPGAPTLWVFALPASSE